MTIEDMKEIAELHKHVIKQGRSDSILALHTQVINQGRQRNVVQPMIPAIVPELTVQKDKTRAIFEGKIQEHLQRNNPTQLLIEMVITPFSPNNNRQAIPKSEAENIKRTCLNQPVKVHYHDGKIHGHANSIPIGTIIDVLETDTKIIGIAAIWSEEFSAVADFLGRNSGKIGSSWEILFARSRIENGIEWLTDTVYCANTLVKSPAYNNETLIRCLSSDLNRRK